MHSLESNWQYVSIDSDNGVAPYRWQGIIWTNDGPAHQRIYVTLKGDGLKENSMVSSWLDFVIYIWHHMHNVLQHCNSTGPSQGNKIKMHVPLAVLIWGTAWAEVKPLNPSQTAVNVSWGWGVLLNSAGKRKSKRRFAIFWKEHYGDVIMGTIASQITSLTSVYLTV